MTTENLQRTPLAERHVALGARMVPFAGWDMPVQYTGIIDEHKAVRAAAGLFDIAHMGVVEVTGPGAVTTLEWLTTNHVAKLEVGRAHYSLLCREDGGILDDLIIYRAGEELFLVVVNASNRAKDFEWMITHVPAGGARPVARDDLALLALQGPNAAKILAKLTPADVDGVPYFGVAECVVAGRAMRIARTGYTGEDGFELFAEAAHLGTLWDTLLDAGADLGLKPIGLGARDTLRLEMGYSLYGHELTESTLPLEAGVGWVVKPAKGDFLGRAAIEAARATGLARKMGGLELTERGVPRSDYPIVADGKPVGIVTSGTSSPSLGKGIAMGYVDLAHAEVGRALGIEVRGKPLAAKVVKLPFVPSHTKK
ncbi:MAG: glycine cleavage system aminomethyltransferase GcvT [Deltaproteobacteria bacterium]|nr:glycine cleavage system aminomethyltransferase GcvT [Deltaproteobacteria bacterium]